MLLAYITYIAAHIAAFVYWLLKRQLCIYLTGRFKLSKSAIFQSGLPIFFRLDLVFTFDKRALDMGVQIGGGEWSVPTSESCAHSRNIEKIEKNIKRLHGQI